MDHVYEMLWDCEYCGTKKLLGKTHHYCPSCGGAQNPEWRYFPSDEEKVAVENHIFTGKDRLCPACQAPSSAAATHCGGCGSPLDGAKEAATRTDQVGDAFAGESVADAKREREQAKGGRPKAPAVAPTRKHPWRRRLAIIALVILGLGTLFYFLGRTEEARVRVAGHAWKREIQVEQLGPVRDSSWCDQMPHDAYRVSHERAVRSHRQVPDGQDCHTRRSDQGDGTFRESRECTPRYREEPIYDDRCNYTVDRWHHERAVVASGQEVTPPPSWPATDLVRQGNCLGCEREGGRSETYTVSLLDAKTGKTRGCDFEEARWASLAPGSEWVVDVGMYVDYTECSSLRPPP
jgi:hypothetical protein